MGEIRDCHYCQFAMTDSPDDECCACYVEDFGYFSHYCEDCKKEAEECHWFIFDDYFPKGA